jgi:hypothetical protein
VKAKKHSPERDPIGTCVALVVLEALDHQDAFNRHWDEGRTSIRVAAMEFRVENDRTYVEISYFILIG